MKTLTKIFLCLGILVPVISFSGNSAPFNMVVAGNMENDAVSFDGQIARGANSTGFLALLGENLPFGFEEKKDQQPALHLYPNPVSADILTVEYQALQKDPVVVTLMDIAGKELYTRNIRGAEAITLDISQLSRGVYLVKTESENHVAYGRFVKK